MKVGNYSFPLYRLNSLLKDTRTLYEKFGKKDVTREHIAQVLDQAATSGGFGQKVADLRSYGLLAGSATKYSISDIGAKATFGTDREKAEALDKAVRLIDLWSKIYEKCGKDPITATFWLDLADITGLERPEAQSKADAVRKAYLEDMKYFLPVSSQDKSAESERPQNGAAADRACDKMATEASQPAAATSAQIMPQGCPSLYHPELSQPIVINSVRTYRAAKIFWDAIEEEWTKKIESEKAGLRIEQNVVNTTSSE